MPPNSSISLRTWLRNATWKKYLKEGGRAIVRSPLNMLVFFLAVNVVCWGAFLVLLLARWVRVGDEETQKLWIEISSQVLNGIFTLAAVPVHPKRFMGLVRALTIWRCEKGIRSQFLSVFLEQFHQTRQLQSPTGDEQQHPSSSVLTLDMSKRELLEMVDYYNAFPEYGRERAAATATTLKSVSLTVSSNNLSLHNQPNQPIANKHSADATTTPTSTSLVDTDTSDAATVAPLDHAQPTTTATTATLSDAKAGSSTAKNEALPQPEQKPPTATITTTPAATPTAQTTAQPPVTRQRTQTMLHIDIPEHELDQLLAKETQRVVHSVVLPFLPVAPSLPADQVGEGPILDAFLEAEEEGNENAAGTGSTETPSPSFGVSGDAAAVVSSRQHQHHSSPSTGTGRASHRSQRSGTFSRRTRCRTRSMTVKDDEEHKGAHGALDEATMSTTTTTTMEDKHNLPRRALARRPTFVVRETSDTLPTYNDDGIVSSTNKEKTEFRDAIAVTLSEVAEGRGDSDNKGDTKSIRTVEEGVCLEPLPLTLEQIEWLDERQRLLIQRQARLQRSWPWYTYTMPAGVEPVDFMTEVKAGSLPAKDGQLLAGKGEEDPQRALLVQSPTKQLLMRSSLACWLLASFNLNSIIQEILCGFMWGWNYKTRPGAVVGVGIALGCLTAVVPSIVILLHEQRLGKARVVASTEEAIQEAIDSRPLQ